jgi:hypothetical protein
VRIVAALQSAYFVATGVWPLLHRRSFEALTGPKTDFWLVQTVGVCVGAVGVGLAQAARRGSVSPELRTVAVLTSASLAAVDVVFVARRRISPVYLADAAVEAALVAGWLAGEPRGLERH